MKQNAGAGSIDPATPGLLTLAPYLGLEHKPKYGPAG